MANKRISEFLDGGLVQTGDEIAAVRGGDNYKVRVGSAAAYDAGQSGGELVILEEDSSGTVMLPAVSGEQLTDLPFTSDPTVQVSIDDSEAGYLEDKIIGSASITVTKNTDSAGDETLVLEAVSSEAAGIPIGAPFPVMTHLDAPQPSNAGSAKFIKLTASDAYNTGLLTSESVTGSAPLVVATAVIDYASSPMNGQTVHLWNTENRYPMPGESAGTVGNDQMQVITGSLERTATNASPVASGAFTLSDTNSGVAALGEFFGTGELMFNSANSPDARTGDHTNVKHEQVTYYMRIA